MSSSSRSTALPASKRISAPHIRQQRQHDAQAAGGALQADQLTQRIGRLAMLHAAPDVGKTAVQKEMREIIQQLHAHAIKCNDHKVNAVLVTPEAIACIERCSHAFTEHTSKLTCSLLLEQLCMTTAATALSKIDQHVPLIEAAAAATAATTAQAPPTTAAPRVVTVVDLASPDPEMGYSFDDEEKLIGSTWIAPSSFDDAMLVDVPLGSPIALPPLAPPVQDVLMSLSLHTAPPPALAGVEGVLISHPMKNSADALLDAAEAMVIDDIATPANVTMQSPSLSMRPRSTSSSADALMVDVEADEKSNAIVAASIDVMVPSAQVIDEQTIAEHSIIPMVLCAAPAVDLLDLDLTMMDVLSETNPSAENLGAIQHSNGAAQKPTAGGNNAIMETAATFKTAVSAPGTLQPVPAPSSRPLISPDADDDTEMSQTALSNEDAAKKAAPRRSTAASAAERTESPLSSDSSSDSSSDESTASTSPTAPADESAPPTAAEEAGIKQTAILATFFEGSCLHQRMIRESTSIDSVLDLCTQINPTYRAKLLAVLIDLIWSMKLDHLHRIAEMVSSLLAQEVSLPSVYRVIQTILSFHRMEPNFDAYRRTMARRLDVGKVVQLLNHPSQAIQRHTLHLCLHISRGRTSLLRPALFSCGFFSLRSLGHFVAEGREDEKEDRRVLSELLEYMDVQYWPMTSASDVPQPLPDAIEVLALIANRSTGFLRIAAVAFVMRCLTQSYVRVDTRVHKVDLLRVLCSMFPHHTAPPVTIATFDAVWAFLMPWVEHATAKKDDALIVQPIVKEIIAEGRLEKLQSLLSDGPMANSTCESLASFFHHHVYGRTPSLQSNDPYLPPQGAATSSESNSSATSSIGGLSVAVTAISRVPQHSRLLQQNQFGRQALYQRAEAARPPAKKSSGGWTKKKMHAIWKFIVERH